MEIPDTFTLIHSTVTCLCGYSIGIAHMYLLGKIRKREQGTQLIIMDKAQHCEQFKEILKRLRPKIEIEYSSVMQDLQRTQIALRKLKKRKDKHND